MRMVRCPVRIQPCTVRVWLIEIAPVHAGRQRWAGQPSRGLAADAQGAPNHITPRHLVASLKCGHTADVLGKLRIAGTLCIVGTQADELVLHHSISLAMRHSPAATACARLMHSGTLKALPGPLTRMYASRQAQPRNRQSRSMHQGAGRGLCMFPEPTLLQTAPDCRNRQKPLLSSRNIGQLKFVAKLSTLQAHQVLAHWHHHHKFSEYPI